jgi:hypothetical protein
VRKVLAISVVYLLLVACTSNNGSQPPSAQPPTPTASTIAPSPSPTKPPKPSLAAAPLGKIYDVKVIVTHTTFDSNPLSRQVFKFDPQCGKPVCNVYLLSMAMKFTSSSGRTASLNKVNVKMAKLNATYAGSTRGFYASCNDQPGKDTWEFRIKTSKVKYVAGRWVIDKWSGTWTRNAPFGACIPGHLRAVVRGTLQT